MKYILALIVAYFLAPPFAHTQNLTETEKLYATCKVWGFLKYYHPSIADGKHNIDEELFELLPTVDSTKSQEEFSDLLHSWIMSFGKVKSKIKNTEEDYFEQNFDFSWQADRRYFSGQLTELLEHIVLNRHQGTKYHVRSDKTSGYAIMTNENEYLIMGWQNKYYRLLCLFRYWNFVEYFYPHKYQTTKNWDDVLKEMIPLFLEAESPEQFELSMLRLVASLDDSHASMMTKNIFNHIGSQFVPFNTRILEGKAVITAVLDNALAKENDVKIGDIILQVDGMSIDSICILKTPLMMGSNQAAKYREAHRFIFNGSTETVEITLERDGERQTKRIKRYKWSDFNRPETDVTKAFQIYDDSIGYINLGMTTKDDIINTLHEMEPTKSLILDFRFGIQNTSQELSEFITTKTSQFYSTIHPDLDFPGKFVWTKGNMEKGNNIPQYNGKVILLVNEYTQSHGEYTAMWLQTGTNVVTVGSQTSGADGNVTEIEMLGGHPSRMTGIGIFYADGTATQRTGVKIDVVVNPTVHGVVMGEDEQLNQALKVARAK